MMLVIALAAGAVGSLVFSGYLVGAKRGQSARAALLTAHAEKEARAQTLESQLVAVQRELERATVTATGSSVEGVSELRMELRQLTGVMRQNERHQETLRQDIQGQLATIAKGSPDAESMRRELHKMMTPLLQRENDTKGLREMMRELVGPMLEKQRLGRELSQLETGTGLGELPRLLDSIADKGGFDTVVLSDDVGLPLAASARAHNVEQIAGFSALLITVSDRIASAGVPAPMGIVVRDGAAQHTLYRIFTVGTTRFMLTAVARGLFLGPEALDPALVKLEKALTRTAEDWS
jgi:hypothetical protein